MNNSLSFRLTRPAYILFAVLAVISCIDLGLFVSVQQRRATQDESRELFDIAVSGLGLTDLCIATEARYTRHPAVSDSIAPFMDHPGAIDHFPTGSFWTPPLVTFAGDR